LSLDYARAIVRTQETQGHDMNKTHWRAGLSLAAALTLQACGGGGSPSTTSNNTGGLPPSQATTAHVTGVVYSVSTGEPLANVAVTLGNSSVTTDSTGAFDLSTPGGQTVNVQASRAGFTDGQSRVTVGANTDSHTIINLAPLSRTQAVASATGGTVTVPNTVAQVTLPANGFVNASTNAPVSGPVTVAITPIDPSVQSRAMPGSYRTGESTYIESFGAVQVQLSDAQGQKLQLAPNKTATLRIPLKTRSADTPGTIPLYYLNESSGLWVQEGTATLGGNATSGFYYEGRVSHFTTWNADRPITETVFVKGCVRDANGNVPTDGVFVMTDGVDYSGNAETSLDDKGNFSVALKKGGLATLTAQSVSGGSAVLPLSASTSDITQGTCLKLDASPTVPAILAQPFGTVVLTDGGTGFLAVRARGVGQLNYQWQRNGVALAGQNGPVLPLRNVTLADNGSVYTVKVSNALGSVTSNAVTINVLSPTQQVQATAFGQLIQQIGNALELITAASYTVDLDNAVMLAPSAVCLGSPAPSLTLDRNLVAGGESISQDTKHTLAVNYANCAVTDGGFAASRGVNLTGNAASSFKYTLSPDGTLGTLNMDTSLSSLTNSLQKLTANGNFSFSVVNNMLEVIPAGGATLQHVTGGASRTLTFTGGSYGASSGAGLFYQNLAFSLNGANYVLNGGITLASSGLSTLNGDVSLLSNGVVVARLRYANNTPIFEFNGTVPTF